MSASPSSSTAETTRRRAPLRALAGGIAVAFLLLAGEAGFLAATRLPGDPPVLDLVSAALPWQALLGVALGLVAWVAGGGAAANARTYLGVPLVIGLAATLAVHLQGSFTGPAAALTSTRSLGLAAAAVAVALVLVWGVRRWARRRGATGSRGPELPAAALAVVLGATAAFLPAGDHRRPAPKGPDVVLVVLDTTRVDRLSAFGYGRPTTPVLERLASEGTRFDRCYSAAPWTVASHASMFTGEHTSTHKATRSHPVLDRTLPTLAERMDRRGYDTVSFSKKSWLSHETGLLRGFRRVFDLYNPPAVPAALALVAHLDRRPLAADKGAAEIDRTAIDWLAGRHSERPFFAFFNFNEAHSDLHPPRRFREQFLRADEQQSKWGRKEFPDGHGFNVGKVSYSPADLAVFSDLYDAEVAYQDARVGELVDALRQQGVLDDTLLIVTADHGENLGDHDLLGHEMSLNETLLHVPLIVRLPGRVEAGAVVEHPVENRLIGRLVEKACDGADALSPPVAAGLLTDGGFEGIVSEEFAPNFRTPKWGFQVDQRFNRIRKSLLRGARKLLWRSDAEHPALYDVLADPGETRDLAAKDEDGAKALLDALLGRADLSWKDPGGEGVRFSPEMEQHLQDMGYF